MKTGVVMDPIAGIKSYKDSTFAMLLEAQRRGHTLFYMEPGDLFAKDGAGVCSDATSRGPGQYDGLVQPGPGWQQTVG